MASKTIRVGKGVQEQIIRYPGSIRLQAQGAADPEAAASGLRRALEEIETLGLTSLTEDGEPCTPNSVGGVVVVPGGPFITSINAPSVPESELIRIPSIIIRHLREAGVRSAVINFPSTSGPLDGMEKTPRAVMLRLYPARADDSLDYSPLLASWIQLASRWLLDHAGGGPVQVRASLSQFPLMPSDVPEFVESPTRGAAVLMAGELGSRVWAIHLTSSLVLGFGGPAASDVELVAMADSFRQLVWSFPSQPAQAFIDINERFGVFDSARHGTNWYVNGGEAPELVDYVCDMLCFDGFPYQVLGPGHLDRIAAKDGGTVPAEIRVTPDGRGEVVIGEFAAWLPESPERLQMREQARRVVAPCLVKRFESVPLIEARRAKQSQRSIQPED